MTDAEFREAVMEDAPDFKRLTPVLTELGYVLTSPHRAHQDNLVVWDSECPICQKTGRPFG